jgi:hypothetical protein
VPKGGKIGEALAYGLNHWGGLTRFLDDGRIEIDSSTVERSIRPLAVSWDRIGADAQTILAITWRELGAGPIKAPIPRYGLSLIRDLIPHELGGTVDLGIPARGRVLQN